MERQSGFYWVKDKGEWIVAEFTKMGSAGFWSQPGATYGYEDSEYEEIDENRIVRTPYTAEMSYGKTMPVNKDVHDSKNRMR